MDCENYKWADDKDLVGPLGIDYVYIDNCALPHLHFLVVIFMFIWVIFLINLLANTASNYFTPTLGSICDKMNLAYDIAGVTFLAFGNGAPDFFSLIASVSGGMDILVSIGALLGGSVFICTVVVGSIALLCPCEVSHRIFLRDSAFYILATVLVTIIAAIQDVSLLLSLSLLVVYLIYVGIVIIASWYEQNSSNDSRSNVSGDIGLTELLDKGTIQTAFWHRNDQRKDPKKEIKMKKPKKTQPKIDHSKESKGYSFLILTQPEDEEEKKEEVKDIEGDNGEETTINLSGGFMPSFDDIIQEDFYSVITDSETNSFIQTEDSEMTLESGIIENNELKQSLLNTPIPGINEYLHDDVVNSDGKFARYLKKRNKTKYENILTDLYWQQWLMNRRFRKSLIPSDFNSYSIFQKFCFVVELPVTLLRDMTIPTLEEDQWFKLYAIIHPISDSLFIAFLLGYSMDFIGNLPIAVLCILVSLPLSFCIYLLTHQSRPPRGKIFTIIWTLIAFGMCIFWIYLIAGELVTCLSALGNVLGIPSGFLGLTVLAWGNSMGDFFTNTSVARQGLGEMALAGCYGGPVFNILVGLGVSFSYACFLNYPNSYTVKLDNSSILSIVFLYIALISTLVIVYWRDFKIEKYVGIFLLMLYAFYTLCQALLLVV